MDTERIVAELKAINEAFRKGFKCEFCEEKNYSLLEVLEHLKREHNISIEDLKK